MWMNSAVGCYEGHKVETIVRALSKTSHQSVVNRFTFRAPELATWQNWDGSNVEVNRLP